MVAGLSMHRVRAVSGAADQLFSSLSNGLIVYAVAVGTTSQDFGQIALLLTLLAAAIGVLRGALGTPLLLKAAAPQADIRAEGSFALMTALLVSPVVGVAMWAVGGTAIAVPTLLIIVATPIVLTQDVLRYIAIAEGRPHIAAIWDGVWAAGSAALLAATWMHASLATTAYLLGGWIALAAAALVGMLAAVRVLPRLADYRTWISGGWRDRARYGAESGLEQATAFASLLLLAVALSPEIVAALRGATALLAPIAIAVSAIPLVMIPQSKRRGAPPVYVWNSLSRIALVTSSLTVLLGIALYFLPTAAGELVLGNSFQATRAVVPIIALEYAIGGWIVSLTIWLRTFNRSADALRLRIVYVSVMLAVVLGAAVLFRTAAGAAAGLATATTFIGALALLRFKPWAEPANDRKSDVGVSDVQSPSATSLSDANTNAMCDAHLNVVSEAAPRRVPLVTRMRIGQAASANGGLITLWVFATMGLFVPAMFIRFTGVPTSWYWLWSLPVLMISSLRFAFLIGSGERRLFEMGFWCFTYAFMGLAPLTQLRLNDWPKTVPRIDISFTGAGTLIALIGCCAFLAGAALDNAVSLRPRQWAGSVASKDDGVQPLFTVNYTRTVLLSLFGVLAGMYLLSQIGWLAFMHSREEILDAETLASPDMSTFATLRAAAGIGPLVAFIAQLRFRQEAKRAIAAGMHISKGVMRSNMVLLIVVGIFLGDIMNPISSPRYLAGTAILAVAAAFGLFSTKQRFRLTACGFLVGMLLIFPLADAFRYSRSGELKASNPIQSLLSGDYDSFAELMNGYLVAAREGIQPGRQFLGVLFFWIPRSLWVDKPMDTGPFIATERGYGFTNLSAPLWIELYLNGGWILLVIGMFALGYALHRWDTKLNVQCATNGVPSVLGCILPFYLMILLRGSLLQAASFLFCIVVFPAFVAQRKKNPKPARISDATPSQPPRLTGRRTGYVTA